MTGKRVCVIGAGSSAVQIVPSIIDQVSRLHVFAVSMVVPFDSCSQMLIIFNASARQHGSQLGMYEHVVSTLYPTDGRCSFAATYAGPNGSNFHCMVIGPLRNILSDVE